MSQTYLSQKKWLGWVLQWSFSLTADLHSEAVWILWVDITDKFSITFFFNQQNEETYKLHFWNLERETTKNPNHFFIAQVTTSEKLKLN